LFEFLCFHHLDGYLLFGFDVDGFEDSGVVALADFVLQGIVLNHFTHLLQ
jgi:hypothetical protein